jgi:hypothetical protein
MASGILAQGVLPNATGDLYEVPASTLTYVTSIMIVNTDGATQTHNIMTKKSGGSDTPYGGQDYSLPSKNARQACVDPQEMRLGAGDKIRGDATGGSAGNSNVKYTIMGIENT